ncbi:hypothetical protein FALB51S_02532 [Frigidibacter albus]|uniref:Nucleotidyltransferase-like domain-containing protein n=1 Tax=Frigidibacter mobilis TaxID=1335048 RepID=A0A159Z1L3_9RHOB|nr:GSU2403 family nucleotidyltransferase fold protein [Frigidibacter mobilis]AMY68855.1 hypothetical protein AKL17_1603 [Frigidibacter mobilis]
MWLSAREDRDPAKMLRDRQQAEVMVQVLRDRLPQFPLDAAFQAGLPKSLRAGFGQALRGGTRTPNW